MAIAMIVVGLLGCIAGLGGFTFTYAKGGSYLTDDPSACANCHIMRPVYDAWLKGSHKAVATCNDCHTPHYSLLAKYAIKGLNGVRHSWAFTSGDFPEPIRITAMDRDIAQNNCIGCHGDLTSLINHGGNKESVDCLLCHSRVGHDE